MSRCEPVSLDKRSTAEVSFGIRSLSTGCPQGLRRLRFSFFLFTCQRTRRDNPSLASVIRRRQSHEPSRVVPTREAAGLQPCVHTEKTAAGANWPPGPRTREPRVIPAPPTASTPSCGRYIGARSQNCQHRNGEFFSPLSRQHAALSGPHLCPMALALWPHRATVQAFDFDTFGGQGRALIRLRVKTPAERGETDE